MAGEPANERDSVYRRIRDPHAQASVTVEFKPAAEGYRALFDIVLDA